MSAQLNHEQARTLAADIRQARQAAGLRHSSLGLAVALIVEFALGIGVNIYITVPAGDHGHGIGQALADALAKGPLALSVHAAIGVLLIVSAIVSLIRAILSRHRFVIVTSVIALLAVLGAAGSGAAFVDSARNSASLTMGLLTALALFCAALNLHHLGGATVIDGAVQQEERR